MNKRQSYRISLWLLPKRIFTFFSINSVAFEMSDTEEKSAPGLECHMGVEGHKQEDPECQGKSAPGLECHMGGKCGEMGHRIQWECPKKE